MCLSRILDSNIRVLITEARLSFLIQFEINELEDLYDGQIPSPQQVVLCYHNLLLLYLQRELLLSSLGISPISAMYFVILLPVEIEIELQ